MMPIAYLRVARRYHLTQSQGTDADLQPVARQFDVPAGDGQSDNMAGNKLMSKIKYAPFSCRTGQGPDEHILACNSGIGRDDARRLARVNGRIPIRGRW